MSYDSENYQVQVRQAEAMERIADALEYFVAEDKGLVLVKPPEPDEGPAIEGEHEAAPEPDGPYRWTCMTCGDLVRRSDDGIAWVHA